MAKEIRVPALGESVTEATIAKWFRQAGETVTDEPVKQHERGEEFEEDVRIEEHVGRVSVPGGSRDWTRRLTHVGFLLA